MSAPVSARLCMLATTFATHGHRGLPTDLADQFGRRAAKSCGARPLHQSPAGGFLNADQFSADQQILQRRWTDERATVSASEARRDAEPLQRDAEGKAAVAMHTSQAVASSQPPPTAKP